LKEYYTELQNNFKIYNVKFYIKFLKSMLKYKILVKLSVLNCVSVCCVFGDIVLTYKKHVRVGDI